MLDLPLALHRRSPVVALACALLLCAARPARAQPSDVCTTDRSAWWDFGLDDYVLNELVLFTLGHAYSQAADAAEVLETVSRVRNNDEESWSTAWLQTAERLGAEAERSTAADHPISASQAYLRAATYLRIALWHNLHPGSEAVRRLAQREGTYFERYLSLSGSSCQPVAIPYGRTPLPGYLCRAAHPRSKSHQRASHKAPMVIFNGGRDVWAEDAKLIADEALKRGYHALLFDGPGQGRALRVQGLPFRHDWEAVITPVIDYVHTLPEVDQTRVALWGESMGGYLVPRAAAHEPRLSALVANPGVLSWRDVIMAQVEQLLPGVLDQLGEDDAALDAAVYAAMEQHSFLRWGLADMMWKHGVSSPAALLHELQHYQLNGAEQHIRVPFLVVDAEADDRSDAQRLFNALPGPKQFLLFTAQEAAQFHDQPGAKAIATQRIYDWLDEHL